jgi:hypothetical protein
MAKSDLSSLICNTYSFVLQSRAGSTIIFFPQEMDVWGIVELIMSYQLQIGVGF